MITNVGAFASGMALREQKEKESEEAMQMWQKTKEFLYLDKAEKATEEANQYGFLGITQGLF